MPHRHQTSAEAVQRVLLVVFDGLRPDLVRADLTPNLHKFLGKATRFADARSVFPSLTRVCSTSIATGAPPSVHGMVGNAFYCPDAYAERPLDLSLLPEHRRLDAVGGTLTAPTFADVLATHGRKLAVVHGGNAGAAYVMAPNAQRQGHWVYSIHGPEATVTPQIGRGVEERFGVSRDRTLPLFHVVDRIADILVDHVLPTIKPDVALAWFPEPDTSGHYLGITAPGTLSVLRRCDEQFGRILDTLERLKQRDSTLVIALSDHGQISVGEDAPMFELLTQAGFPAASMLSDDLVLMGVKGTFGELRILRGGKKMRSRVISFLQEQPFTGHLFTADLNGVEGVEPGTFSQKLVDLDHGRAPDIVFTLKSTSERDAQGLHGHGFRMGEVSPGGGMHGGLNYHEMANLLALGGPMFAEGAVVNQPAGLIDVAPTVLQALGIRPAASMTGRSLFASFEGGGAIQMFTARHAAFEQRIAVARLESGRYFIDPATRTR